jgi:hypothetical protein
MHGSLILYAVNAALKADYERERTRLDSILGKTLLGALPVGVDLTDCAHTLHVHEQYTDHLVLARKRVETNLEVAINSFKPPLV